MVVIYTDGACSGNPGPGGWAWAEVDGAWASGFEAESTNQRMELCAVIAAVERFEGPLRIVSDSTYVVNCWRDRWWQGWLKRGWKNSQRKPVANRDLWERLVPHFRDRPDLGLEWVKGHSGDHWNDVVDRLAVAAVQNRSGAAGTSPPTEADLGDPDAPTSGSGGSAARGKRSASGSDPSTDGGRNLDVPGADGDVRRSDGARARDGRVPAGFLVVVGGTSSPVVEGSLGELSRIIAGWVEMHSDAVVLTGLREGAEALAARAAREAGAPYVVVLPYPDPAAAWSKARRARFEAELAGADSVVTLERSRPADAEGRRKALGRRDGWLRSVADQAVILTESGDDTQAEHKRWTKALGDDVWNLEVD
ncbi:MAG: ribonuclease H [Microthrixaceae bacterium]